MDASVFFQSWSGVLRVVVVGVLAYAALILVLRLTGKRTLSKLNAFDLIVTVALGSTLSSILISQSVALVEGLVALALLVLLQFAVTWTTVRWPDLRDVVTADPSLLLSDGRPCRRTLRRERVSESEVLQAIRDKGGQALEDAEAVILQSDGGMAVILKGG